jgi:SAM-dependent methyltransferase
VEYEAVRQAEGRGSPDPAYYRRLPGTHPTDPFHTDWQIRRRTYAALLRFVLAPLEQQRGRPLRLLDLGAGNAWLAYRMAQRGHIPAAVDLRTGSLDGLGAHIYYDAAFTPVQADFDQLPFAGQQADLVIYNAALHYSTDYFLTLREGLRLLAPGGVLAVLDTPIYRDARSGEAMAQERQARFCERFGFRSDALPSENYLTWGRLESLGRELGVAWQIRRPFYGLRWMLRPWLARLRGKREPAQFALLIGSKER